MNLFAKCFHGIDISKRRIYLCIICCIILMIRFGFHYRIQIDTCYSKILEVVKLTFDSFQISAEFLIIGNTSMISPRQNIFCIFLRSTVTKSVGKYLIPYGVVYPRRCNIYIRRIHPRHNEALQHPAVHMELFFC